MYAGAIITMMTSVQTILMLYNQIRYTNDYLKTYEEFIKKPNMHYEGTLPIENIAGGEKIDRDKMENVIAQVGLESLVGKLPEKEHTLLYHENGDGVALSKGEAQKVAIARALYKNAPFVILDEPTAALDPIAEAEIYENFDTLVGDKTAIYISSLTNKSNIHPH